MQTTYESFRNTLYQLTFTYQHPKQEVIGEYLAQIPGLGWITPLLNSAINWDSGTPDI